jgi:hypothetical protein
LENTPQDKSNWLQELSNQSWNLEFVVSGAAIFSTSFLPQLLDDALASYFENYQLSDSLINEVLPILAYSFGKASSYLLIFTFILHFVLRAFWIAMVGLKAVFPSGIKYKNLPNSSDEVKEHMKKKLGKVDDYIISLDKTCSQIFSIAFYGVLMSLMIAVFYLLSFLITVVSKTYTPQVYVIIRNALLTVFSLVFIFFLSVTILSFRKENREKPYFIKMQKMLIRLTSLMYFGFDKPLNHILLIFASNIKLKKYYTYLIVSTIAFMVLAMSIYMNKLFTHIGLPVLDSRNYYTSGSTDYQLKPTFYDNLRPEGEFLQTASIQSDVIQDPFIKVFINYNKILDEKLAKICVEPKIPKDMERLEKRSLKDKTRTDCFNTYFKIAINDSTLKSVEFYFTEHGVTKSKGLSAYVSSENCKIGRNLIHIKALEVDSLPKKIWTSYVTIPFWYAKN